MLYTVTKQSNGFYKITMNVRLDNGYLYPGEYLFEKQFAEVPVVRCSLQTTETGDLYSLGAELYGDGIYKIMPV